MKRTTATSDIPKRREDRAEAKKSSLLKDPSLLKKPEIKEQRPNKENERKKEVRSEELQTKKTVTIPEVVETVEGAGDAGASAPSSLRIGYWMDRLLSGVDQLSILDKQVGRIQENVKTFNHEESKQDTTEDKLKNTEPVPTKAKTMQKSKSKSDDLFKITETASTKTCKPSNVDDELFQLTANIQRIQLKDTKVSAELPTSNFEKKIAEKLRNSKLDTIKAVLDSHTEHDKAEVLEHLTTLSSMKLTVQILQSSKVGVALNTMRKQTTDTEIINLAKSILKAWKKLLPVESGESKLEKVPEASLPKPSTEAEIREYCQKKLLKSLQSNSSLSDSCKLRAEQLAKQLEENIFQIFKETNQKYRNQVYYRSHTGSTIKMLMFIKQKQCQNYSCIHNFSKIIYPCKHQSLCPSVCMSAKLF